MLVAVNIAMTQIVLLGVPVRLLMRVVLMMLIGSAAIAATANNPVEVQRHASLVFSVEQSEDETTRGPTENWSSRTFTPVIKRISGDAELEYHVHIKSAEASDASAVDNPSQPAFVSGHAHNDTNNSSDTDLPSECASVPDAIDIGTIPGKYPTSVVLHYDDEDVEVDTGRFYNAKVDIFGITGGTKSKFPDYANTFPRRPGTPWQPVIKIMSGGTGDVNGCSLYGVVKDGTNHWTLSAEARDAESGMNIPQGYSIKWVNVGAASGASSESIAVTLPAGRYYPRLEVYFNDPEDGEKLVGVAEIHSLVVENSKTDNVGGVGSQYNDVLKEGTKFFAQSNVGGCGLPVDARFFVLPNGVQRGRTSLNRYPQNQYWVGNDDSADLYQVVTINDKETIQLYVQGYREPSPPNSEGFLKVAADGQAFLEACAGTDLFEGNPVNVVWQMTDRDVYDNIRLALLTKSIDVDGDDDDSGHSEVDADWYGSRITPKPTVALTLGGVSLESDGTIVTSISVGIRDGLSDLATSPSEQIQFLKIKVNGQLVDTIEGLPSQVGSGDLWSPKVFDVKVDRTIRLAHPGNKPLVIQAETGPNARGKIGRDSVSFAILWQSPGQIQGLSSGLDAELQSKLAFSGALSLDTREEIVFTTGASGVAPNGIICQESLDTAGLYTAATADTAIVIRLPAEVQPVGGVADVIPGTIELRSLQHGISVTLTVAYREDVDSSGVYLAQQSPENVNRRILDSDSPYGGIAAVRILSGEKEDEASTEGGTEPVLLGIEGLNESGDHVVVVNGIERDVMYRPTAGREVFLPMRQSGTGNARMAAAANADSQVQLLLRSDNIEGTTGVDLNSGSDNTFSITDDDGNEVVTEEDETVVEEETEDEPADGQVQSTVTLNDILPVFKLLYGEKGQLLLSVYSELPGNTITVGDVYDDIDLDGFYDGDLEIEVEEDVNPVEGAALLWQGLNLAMPYMRDRIYDPTEEGGGIVAIKLALAAREAVGRAAAEATAPMIHLYISGITIVNEGADWAMTLNDLSEGDYLASLNFLPFVSGVHASSGKVIRAADGTEIRFTNQVINAIKSVPKGGYRNYAAIYNHFKAAGATIKQMEALVKAGLLPVPKHHGTLKNRIIRAGVTKPAGFAKAAVHHDMPWKFRRWFAARGIDCNLAKYGRWVDNAKGAAHQRWSAAFEAAWERFIAQEPPAGYTAAAIETFMTQLRNSGRYPSQ